MSLSLEQRKEAIRHYLETAWERAEDTEQSNDTTPTLAEFSADQKDRASLPNTVATLNPSHNPSQTTQDYILCPVYVRQIIRASLPDLHFTLLELIAEGETVVARWSIQGTDHGGYEGHLPTGRPVYLTGITLIRIEGHKIVEECCETNLASMQRQLGFVALPAPRITIRQPGPKRSY